MNIEQFSVVLGISAGGIQLLGYVLYIRRANGRINTGSWSIWAFTGLIDLVSFFALTRDWVVNILPAACAVAAISVFIWALIRKRLSWPDRTDWYFVGGDAAITVVWVYTNAVIANILYQVSTFFSFIPIWRGQLAGREREDPLAWFIWTGSYGLLTASVTLRLDRWEELVYPASHAMTHFIVAVIAFKRLSR